MEAREGDVRTEAISAGWWLLTGVDRSNWMILTTRRYCSGKVGGCDGEQSRCSSQEMSVGFGIGDAHGPF